MAMVFAHGATALLLQALVWLDRANGLVVRILAPPSEVVAAAHRIHPIADVIGVISFFVLFVAVEAENGFN